MIWQGKMRWWRMLTCVLSLRVSTTPSQTLYTAILPLGIIVGALKRENVKRELISLCIRNTEWPSTRVRHLWLSHKETANFKVAKFRKIKTNGWINRTNGQTTYLGWLANIHSVFFVFSATYTILVPIMSREEKGWWVGKNRNGSIKSFTTTGPGLHFRG